MFSILRYRRVNALEICLARMDETHSLLLNEEALMACPDPKKPVFIYEWLRYLDRILPVVQKADLKSIQPKLLQQLEARLTCAPGPSTRHMLAKCVARVYVAGDPYSIHNTVNICNDSLKSKDESPSQLPSKLAALACLSALYENVGRLVGRSYDDSFQLMCKWMKTAESQGRAEIMNTMTSIVIGLNTACSHIHKEMYKMIKVYMTDRALNVRVAAINCAIALVPFYPPLYATDLEAMCAQCLKALDGSNYETRLAVSKLFATLFATAMQPPPGATVGKSTASVPVTPLPLDSCLQMLASGFLRGGIGGFLKSGSWSNSAAAGGSSEVRVGVAMGYVYFLREMGPAWLERNVGAICKHLMELAAKSGHLAYTTNQQQASEAAFMRRCISYILRATIGTLLGENAQLTACKYLGSLLADYINSFDYTVEPGSERSLGPEAYASSQAAVVAVLEISSLVRQIGTAVTPLFVEASGINEPIFACLLHPILGARVATAWCLRAVTLAVPSILTNLIDRCLSRLDHMKLVPDAISGYSLALAALVAASTDCKLGIPHGKPKQVLNCAEDLLKTATQQSRLTVARINAGWILLNSLVHLGAPVMKDHLPRLCQLWRAAFPRSAKEAENEKTRGDTFSWQCALESRAGALSVMCSVAKQRDLLNDETTKSMLLPLECSLVMMAQVSSLVSRYGVKMRQLIGAVRIRVYELLQLLSPRCYENLYASLLREVVADVTLSDNVQSTTCTSLPMHLCTGAEQTLLNPFYEATDQSMVEDLLHAQIGHVGSIENDPVCLISGSAKFVHDLWPEPEAPQVACVDAAILTYAKIFPLVPAKHRQQITDHFSDVIKNCRNAQRQQSIQLNVMCALVGTFRAVAEHRGLRIDNDALQKSSVELIVSSMGITSSLIRCLAAEALGRLAQAVGDPQCVASMAQYCFDKLKSLRDAPSRAAYSLALGCLHRHVGSLGSGQHLNTGVSILLALAQDQRSPIVQAWSIIALALVAETGGGMFRGYVEPVLSVCLKLLLTTPLCNVEVVQCIGKLLSALMTCVGPELGSVATIEGIRGSLLSACAIQLAVPDPIVRAEAVAGLQQMHLYASRYVHLSHLVVDIGTFLVSEHLVLRRASVCCLRQLVQKEAREVREHAQVLVPQGVVDEGKKLPLPDSGLEGALFAMLDVETNAQLREHVQETLHSLAQATCGEQLNSWLLLCKDILATSSDNTRSTMVVEDKSDKNKDDDEEEEGGDDDATLAGARSTVVDKGKLQPRWLTRVFATEIVQRLMTVCDTERAHLDLALAKELQMSTGGSADYLVLHLSDLVRMSFMGATSDNTELRLAGLSCLQDVINRFSTVPEPEFPGHVILEQFQAQVGAALRPAFAQDTPSHVTAAACQVCSTWIGSGVARDLNDLRRVHGLLVSSLNNLRKDVNNTTPMYSESAATLEKLAILKAWAEVYVTAIEQDRQLKGRPKQNNGYDDELACTESLLSLVLPELTALVGYWLAALRDAALLSLPALFTDQLPTEGGAFFKMESAEACRAYYRTSWPPILLATSMWLQQKNFELPSVSEIKNTWPSDKKESRFILMLGVAVDALSNKTTCVENSTIQVCVRSITALLSCDWCRLELMRDVKMAIELCNVLHRILLTTRDNLTTQRLALECAFSVLRSALYSIECCSNSDVENGNVASEKNAEQSTKDLFKGGEGDAKGLGKGGTLSFALLEVCVCVMAGQMPQINSSQMQSRSQMPMHFRRIGRLSTESSALIQHSIHLLVKIPSLCCPAAQVVVLPIVVHLLIGFIRESARIDKNHVVPDLPPGHLTSIATASLQALRSIASNPPTDGTLPTWSNVMRSALYSILVLADAEDTIDRCVIMLSAVVLVSVAPRAVVLGHAESVNRMIAIIKEQLASTNTQVMCKTLQSVTSVFTRRDISATFVRNLGPVVFNVLRPIVLGNEEAAKHISEDQLLVVQDAAKALEVLVTIADEKKRLNLLALLVQSLCRLVCAVNADEWRALSLPARTLHEFAIARLNAIAPLWPHEFKQILASHADMKARLEGAMLLQSTRLSQAQMAAAAKAKSMEVKTSATQQPTIKLVMDFNAFGKAAS